MGASSRYLKQFLAIVLQKGFPFSKKKIKFLLYAMRYAVRASINFSL